MTLAHSDLLPLIRERNPFKAGNVYAETKNGVYVVYSYGEHFPLAVHRDDRWFVNHDRYSVSTSCQQSKTGVRCLPGAATKNTKELCAMVRYGSTANQVAETLLRSPKYA